MTHWKTLAALILASLPLPATAAIRGVFIGIDKYAYSEGNVDGAGFKDLSGAVNDARRIKEALRSAYGLDLDKESPGKCPSANAVSITLINECATNKEIFKAWRKQIAASAKGDTLILYFAGHGSQLIDKEFRQSSGYNSTIMPHDARNPKGEEETEILDTQIKEVIEEATAKGINVVSIFDSCNSATATRDGPAEGEARAAPRRTVSKTLLPMAPYTQQGFDRGYRVHLAASADGQEAREVGAVGNRSGVFTTALAETLQVPAMRNATFADIATEVRLKVVGTGHTKQLPHAEGALTATMGGKEQRVPLFDAVTDADEVWLAGGQLTGVTVGSRYALFETTTSARDDDAKPRAHATVKAVEPSRAALSVEGEPVAALPKRLIARETDHAFGQEQLLVRNDALPDDRNAVAGMLATMNFVRIGEPATLAVVPSPDGYKIVGADGFAIASLGPLSAPEFAAQLRGALQKVARVQMLLALRTDPSRADAHFCIGHDLDANAFACQPATQADGPAIDVGKETKLIVVNRTREPRYLYVFAIDQFYEVKLALPGNGGIDSAVEADRPITDRGWSNAKGPLTFLTLSTDQPIKASVLEQSGAGARDPAGCVSALARALCAAQQGTRNPAVPRVGNWTATVTSVTVN